MTDPLPDLPPPYATVVFDCDSTLSTIEGIDELAGEHRAELKAITDRAMAGEVPLEEVFGLRLERVRPTRAQVEQVGRRYVETAVLGAAELIASLRQAGVRVLILSGGLLPAVRHLGTHLGIPLDDVHAVDLTFDTDGHYADFDRTSPLTRTGGKPALLRQLRVARPAALVGDGITDLECLLEGAVDRFVAFEGVVRRPAVVERAVVRCDRLDANSTRRLLLP
ncbi:MAG: HAD-IB family phosphatase [Planctomycetota bacterium]